MRCDVGFVLNEGLPHQDSIAVLKAQGERKRSLWRGLRAHNRQGFSGHFGASRQGWWKPSDLVHHVALTLGQLNQHGGVGLTDDVFAVHLEEQASGFHVGLNPSVFFSKSGHFFSGFRVG